MLWLWTWLACLGCSLASTASFSTMISPAEFSAMFQVDILEYQGKKCRSKNPLGAPRACERYCAAKFAYAPTAQYRNAQSYNATSQLCQPRPVCAASYSVRYNSTLNACVDVISGEVVPGVNASDNLPQRTLNVGFVCAHGSLTSLWGVPDCLCDFGYTNSLKPSLAPGANLYLKCDLVVPIEAYFPTYLALYYDETLDNVFPNPNDPSYWLLLAAFALKYARNRLRSAFQPPEVQLALLVIPKEGWAVAEIEAAIALACLAVLICLLTLAEKISQRVSDLEASAAK